MLRYIAAALALGLATTACGGGDDSEGNDALADRMECPLDALDDADQPVEIVFWHTMARANETALQQLTDEYNESQSKVRVKLVNNTEYDDQQDKYRAGLNTGDLPDVVLHQDIFLQQLIDTKSVLPAQICMDEADFDTDDFVARTLEYYQIDDVQWGLPFNVSNPVLYYDRAAFEKAGLDPDEPPEDFDELRDAAEKIKASGYSTGMSLKVDSWQFEELLAQQDATLVNHANGRDGRATDVTFDGEAGRKIFENLGSLIADGLATPNPRRGPSQFDNILGIGTHEHAMTFDTSAALGTIHEVLGSGQYADVELGVGPLPGRGAGGVVVGGAALYISADEPAKQAAAWDYMTFLTSPESQSKWGAATGYIPVRTSSVDLPEIKARWEEVPGFRVAYDQLVEAPETDATAGAVVGPYESVRDALELAADTMFIKGGSSDEAIADAAVSARSAIEAYNSRL